MGLFQGISLGGMTGFCLLDCDFTAGLHLPNHGSTVGLCLPNGSCTWQTSASLMALVAWVSFQHVAMSAFHASSLWWEFRVALVMSSHSRATFISPCSWSTSLAGQLDWPWGAQDCGLGEMTGHASGVFDMAGGKGEWLTWTMLGMCLSVTSPGDACEEVAIRSGMAKSVPSRPSGSSALVEGRTPKATDGSFLLDMLCWEVGAGVVGEVCCSCSKAPWRCRLRTNVMSHGGLTARRGWYQCSVGGLWFHATQVHLYQGQISGGSICGGSIPEWQLLERELKSLKLPI